MHTIFSALILGLIILVLILKDRFTVGMAAVKVKKPYPHSERQAAQPGGFFVRKNEFEPDPRPHPDYRPPAFVGGAIRGWRAKDRAW